MKIYGLLLSSIPAFLYFFYLIPVPQTGHIPYVSSEVGNFIWEDLDADGLQDPNEPGVQGVVVSLFDCNDLNTPLFTTSTDSSGFYNFNNITPGEYQLFFELPYGYNFTTPNSGNNSNTDSDANIEGWTSCLLIPDKETIDTIDVGLTPCNTQVELFCLTPLTVAMNDQCIVKVTPDLILLGDNLCFDFFNVELFWNGNSIGATLTQAQVGNTVEAHVTNLNNGNFCTSTLTIIDNLSPVIISCDTLFTTCSGSTLPQDIGGITVEENCDTHTISYTDISIQGDCNTSYLEKIERNWTVTDASGNTSNCTQIIFREKPILPETVFPKDYDGTDNPPLSCSGASTHPDSTGWPTIDGIPIKSGSVCGLKSFYFDQMNYGNCSGSSSLLRSWTVVNNCTNENLKYDQIIDLADTDAPTIICVEDITASTSTTSCNADVLLPSVDFSDNCSGFNDIELFIVTPTDTLFDNGGWWFEVPPGEHAVTYVAVDDCGNFSNCTFSLTIIDNVAPQPTAEESIVVALGSDGSGTACAESYDLGSTDNCQIVAIKLKRADAPSDEFFKDCVTFTCEDLDDTVNVRMRVYDLEGDYSEEDAQGRFNEVMVQTTVQDKKAPSLSCPFDITIDCWEDYLLIPSLTQDSAEGFAVFRDSQLLGYYNGVIDNCEIDKITVSESGMPNNCGEGTISRTWTVSDLEGNENSCVQTITLDNAPEFYITDTDCNDADPEDGIVWPCSFISADCAQGTGTEITGEPQLNPFACNLVGISFEDQFVAIQDSACFSIFRKWLVLDWCQPDTTDPLGYKTWSYIQEVRILNSAAPSILSPCEETLVCGYAEDCTQNAVNLILEAEDDCTDFTDLLFNYEIDIFDDNSVDIIGSGNDAGSFFPLGSHRIKWKVEDRCGNISSCNYTFTVEDCKAPTPICKIISSVITAPNSEVIIPATSFENGDSQDNCTDYDGLIFSYSPDITDTIKTFTCDDISSGQALEVEIYATDEAGNQDKCQTLFFLNDPFNYCNGVNANITGSIVTGQNQAVGSVNVSIQGSNNPGQPQNALTSSNGLFTFNVTPGDNYSIQPSKTIDPRNGVTTFDLVLISRHILGVEKLDSPYKVIAADANGDNKVTTFDIIEFRKLILQIYPELPNVPSWRFVEKSYIFPDPDNPFVPAFPEVINLNDVQGSLSDNDFIGIKTGDVDENADPLEFTSSEDRFGIESEKCFLKDKLLYSGEHSTLEIEFPQQITPAGFQLALNIDTDALALQSIEANLPDFSAVQNANINKGNLIVSWTAPTETEAPIRLTIELEALKPGQLSDFISWGIENFSSELYSTDKNGALQKQTLIGVFNQVETAKLAIRCQPNPFNEQTQLLVSNIHDEKVQLSIFNTQGQLILQEEYFVEDASAVINIDREQLRGNGLYFYQLRTEKEWVEGKFVLSSE